MYRPNFQARASAYMPLGGTQHNLAFALRLNRPDVIPEAESKYKANQREFEALAGIHLPVATAETI